MLPTVLIQLVETHADNLAEGLLRKLMSSDRCHQLMQRVPAEELKRRVSEIYSHLGDWLLRKMEFEIEERYIGLGMRRAKQGVPLRELIWTLNTVKEYLWGYLEEEGLLEQPVDPYGNRELLLSVERFFDRAVYFAAVGYESVETQIEQALACT